MRETAPIPFLLGEIDLWESEGIVNAAQAESLRARYSSVQQQGDSTIAEQPGVGDVGRRSSQERLTEVVATVGAVLLGLGVILLVATNWSDISRGLRVVGLLAAMLAFQGGGFYLSQVRRLRRTVGAALLLTGTLIYGAAIFLVGQIYHVQAHDPLALLAWSLGAGGVALVARSLAHSLLFTLTFGGWIGYEFIFAFDQGSALSEVTADVAVVSAAAAATYGVALFVAGHVARALGPAWLPRREIAAAFRPVGMLVAGCALLVASFAHEWEAVDPIPTIVLAILGVSTLVSLALVGVWLARARLASEGSLTAREPHAFAACTLGVALLALMSGVSAALLANVLLAIVVAAAIAIGYLRTEREVSTVGLILLTAWIFARYVDFMWGMVSGSLFFIGAGCLLLLLGLLLNRRHDLRNQLEGLQ